MCYTESYACNGRFMTAKNPFSLIRFFLTHFPVTVAFFSALNQREKKNCILIDIVRTDVFAGADQVFDVPKLLSMKQNAFTALFVCLLVCVCVSCPTLFRPVIQFSFCFISRYVLTCLKWRKNEERVLLSLSSSSIGP